MDKMENRLEDKKDYWQWERDEMRKKLKWYEHKYGPYIEKRGMQNWKNLFRKPTLTDWTILFMLAMGLFIAWAYNHDISACQQTLINLTANNPNYQTGYHPSMPPSLLKEVNLTNLSLTDDSSG